MATKMEEPEKEEEPKEEKDKEEGREAANETEMKEDLEKTGGDKSGMDTAGEVKEGAEGTTPDKAEEKAVTEKEKKREKKKRLRFLYKSLCEQIEFYFGDANLSRDGFLKKTIDKSPDGWVDAKVFLTFNKIKQKTEDINVIMHALKKSEFLEADSEKLLVRRKTPYKKPQDTNERTVYVENLPKHVNIDWVKQKFSSCGNILYVSIPRFKTTKDIKGFAFIEYDTKEAAAKAVETLNNPEPEKKPGVFPKGNKTLDALRKKTGAEGAAVEQAFARERFQGKGGPSGDSSGGAGPSHKKKRRESAAATEEGMEVGERPAGQESSSGGRRKRRESLEGEGSSGKKLRKEGMVEGEAGSARKRKESLVEGEGIPAKKQRRGRGESEEEEAAARRQEGSEEGAAGQDAGQEEQSRKRKKREEQQKTAEDEEDKVFGEEKGSSPEEEEDGPSPTKRKYRSQSAPDPSGRDSIEEPGVFERQQSDPGKTSGGGEKSKTKHKRKKKKKRKHRHAEDKKAQEGGAATGTKANERGGKADEGRGGRGDKRHRKSFEVEVVNPAPKILKSAISSDKTGRPQKKVTIKEDPPEELGAKEKENEAADGKPGKRKRKHKHHTSERRTPAHLRVLPMSEWLSLRQEYKQMQKEVVHKLKKKLRELEKRKSRTEEGKEPQFMPNTVVCMEPPGPVSRKQLINAIGEEKVQVAYIEMKADSAKGYIRCKDSDSAEFIVSRSEEMPDYRFRLLQGEEEQAYWAKLQEERKKKYEKESISRSKKSGRKRLFQKVQKASVVGRERNHIIFDED